MEPTFVAIVGPTASGKSSLAMRLAELFNGEIVAADSRTVYKGMDIGTAKPSRGDRQKIPHHCLDLVEPNERYSAHDYQLVANQAIDDILARGKLPILAGGSGMYLDAVLYDYNFEGRGLGQNELPDDLVGLQQIAKERGYDVPDQVNQNPRHLKGFVARGGKSGDRRQDPRALILGISVAPDELKIRISKRAKAMIASGFVQEVKELVEKYGPDAPGFKAPGYGPAIDFLSSKISEQELLDLFIKNDIQLAKRQMTWFKRNTDINWVSSRDEAEQLLRAKFPLV